MYMRMWLQPEENTRLKLWVMQEADADLGLEFSLRAADTAVAPALLASMRLLLMAPDELEGVAQAIDGGTDPKDAARVLFAPVSADNEADVKLALTSLLEALYQALPGDEHQDADTLRDDTTLTHEHRCALTYRSALKQIVANYFTMAAEL